MQIRKIEKQIEEIKAKLVLIGEMRPGSLNLQFTACGRSNCRCMKPNSQKKHGPYYQLSYVHQGKSTSQFIRKEWVGSVRLQLANYKHFKDLTAQWVDLALTLAKQKLLANKDRSKRKTQALRQEKQTFGGTGFRDTAE